MQAAFDYDTLVARNTGYLNPATQAKIRQSRILIAGCGVGSSVAVCAARMGFQHFVLADGDAVEMHNLNRQFYDFADLGRPKALALKDQILRINPRAQVEAHVCDLKRDNVDAIVARADIVFDTVDFLDLDAILALHASAREHRRELFSAMSVGFGGGVLYFPAASALSLADIVAPDLQAGPSLPGPGLAGPGAARPSYAHVFAAVMARIAGSLDAEVVREVAKALTIMEDGKPCPASQIAVGSFTIGALAVAMMHDMLAGLPVASAPNMVVHSFRNHATRLVDLSGSAA